MDMVDSLMAYEEGSLSSADTLKLFSGLIKDGLAWKLQGCCGRTANRLIEAGYLSDSGEILKEFD